MLIQKSYMVISSLILMLYIQIRRRENTEKIFTCLTHEEQQKKIADIKHERFFRILFLPILIIFLISAFFTYPTNQAILFLRGGFVMLDLIAVWLSNSELYYCQSHIKSK